MVINSKGSVLFINHDHKTSTFPGIETVHPWQDDSHVGPVCDGDTSPHKDGERDMKKRETERGLPATGSRERGGCIRLFPIPRIDVRPSSRRRGRRDGMEDGENSPNAFLTYCCNNVHIVGTKRKEKKCS